MDEVVEGFELENVSSSSRRCRLVISVVIVMAPGHLVFTGETSRRARGWSRRRSLPLETQGTKSGLSESNRKDPKEIEGEQSAL